MGRIWPVSQPRLLPLEQWPQADLTAWHRALEDAGPFGPSSVASAWSEDTCLNIKLGYARWLAWLLEHGEDLDQPPPDRITPARVAAYIADLRRINSDFTVLMRISALCDAMRLFTPKRDWGWLRTGRNNLAARCVPVRNKAARIKPVDELIKLGRAHMRKAERAPKLPPLSRAVLFRDGLMIVLLAYCPVRLSNLAMITLGRHLFRRNSGYDLHFSRDEVKWGQPIERSVPTDLVAAFSRYLDHYRPVLLTRGGLQNLRECGALWISRKGTPLHHRTIRGRIKEHTRVAFGEHLWPHLFRDCTTTFVATEAPQQVRIVKSLLGHRKMRTSEKHYNQARSLEASRRYQQILADWLDGSVENGAHDP